MLSEFAYVRGVKGFVSLGLSRLDPGWPLIFVFDNQVEKTTFEHFAVEHVTMSFEQLFSWRVCMMHSAVAGHQPYSDRKTVPTGAKAYLPLRRVKRLAVNRHDLQLTRVVFWRRMPLDADECPWLTSGTQAGAGYKEEYCSNDAHSSNELVRPFIVGPRSLSRKSSEAVVAPDL
jgi:hypothetical protein